MAIINSMWMTNTKKKLGGTVLYQAMGQTRQRELAATVSNPRTQSQMEQRTRWANLVNFYRANANWMKFAYETKKTNQSEYNKFMSLNVPGTRIYLPKSLASQGACIVDAYQMTQGSLPSIEVQKITQGWKTNIYVTNAEELDENATIGEVTQVILPANPGMREGDQLSFLRFTQMTNASTGVPFVIVRKYEVILKANDTRRFYDFMPYDYISWGGSGDNQYIGVTDSGNAGGFLLALSRTIGGKTYVSTQSIVVANNGTLIEAYSSESAKQAAIDSYGESTEPFLSSSSADEDSQAATRLAPLYLDIEGTKYMAGQVAAPASAASADAIKVVFNQELAVQATSIAITFWKAGIKKTQAIQVENTTGNTVRCDWPDAQGMDEAAIADVVIATSGDSYRLVFVVPNEYTQGGLD